MLRSLQLMLLLAAVVAATAQAQEAALAAKSVAIHEPAASHYTGPTLEGANMSGTLVLTSAPSETIPLGPLLVGPGVEWPYEDPNVKAVFDIIPPNVIQLTYTTFTNLIAGATVALTSNDFEQFSDRLLIPENTFEDTDLEVTSHKDGNTLTFTVPELQPKSPMTLTYSMQLTHKCEPGSCCDDTGNWKEDGTECSEALSHHHHNKHYHTGGYSPEYAEGHHRKDKALPLCQGTCHKGHCKVTYEAFKECSPGY